jgi:hypothetical protein
VLCLNGHQVAFGRPAEILDEATLERTYGESIITLPDGVHAVLPPHHHC